MRVNCGATVDNVMHVTRQLAGFSPQNAANVVVRFMHCCTVRLLFVILMEFVSVLLNAKLLSY